MAYTAVTHTKGEVLTAAAVNNLEQGLQTATTVRTRTASYWFGGAENSDGDWGGATAITERTRFQLTVQPNRYRVHVMNYIGLQDTAPTTTPLTNLKAWVGPRVFPGASDATNWTFNGTPQQVATGSGDPVGLTEWVSGWTTPTTDLTLPSLIDIQFNLTVNTPLALHNASHSAIKLSAAGGDTTALSINPGADPTATAWGDYFMSLLQVWIEYEYTDESVTQGLCIGHSFTDNASYANANPWDGQVTGWPQQVARKNRQAITVNAYSNSTAASFQANSTKWSKFTNHTFDWILIDVAGNDIQSGTSPATVITSLIAMIEKCRSLWPKARIYVATLIPNKPQDTVTAHETARQQLNALLSNLVGVRISGLVDFERALWSPTDVTTVDPKALDLNTTVAARHLSPLGGSMLASAVNIR